MVCITRHVMPLISGATNGTFRKKRDLSAYHTRTLASSCHNQETRRAKLAPNHTQQTTRSDLTRISNGILLSYPVCRCRDKYQQLCAHIEPRSYSTAIANATEKEGREREERHRKRLKKREDAFAIS
ncbi:unnamed protein product [Lasius platythorax]|uniref:Uncharacterized protein n=1 Tax=Lasius platythorax TaxID=488582 RepID=A0AAV2N6Z4_9HYME